MLSVELHSLGKNINKNQNKGGKLLNNLPIEKLQKPPCHLNDAC